MMMLHLEGPNRYAGLLPTVLWHGIVVCETEVPFILSLIGHTLDCLASFALLHYGRPLRVGRCLALTRAYTTHAWILRRSISSCRNRATCADGVVSLGLCGRQQLNIRICAFENPDHQSSQPCPLGLLKMADTFI